MLTRLFNLCGAISLATLLAAGGFVGYLFGTGRLNGARTELIAAVVRGELDNPAPTTAPASQPAEAVVETGGAPTREELKATRERRHLELLETERAARDLEAQRRLLDQVLQQTVQEQEKLATDRQALAQEKKKSAEPQRDEGFAKEVELVSGLAAKQAKEHLLRVWQKQPADAVRLLDALSPSTAKKILEQFKTPEELQTRTDLLEQVRLHGKELSARVSGTTGGAAAP